MLLLDALGDYMDPWVGLLILIGIEAVLRLHPISMRRMHKIKGTSNWMLPFCAIACYTIL